MDRTTFTPAHQNGKISGPIRCRTLRKRQATTSGWPKSISSVSNSARSSGRPSVASRSSTRDSSTSRNSAVMSPACLPGRFRATAAR